MISDGDFENIKKRLQADNIKFQFGVGNMEEQKIMSANLASLLLSKTKNCLLFATGKILLIENSTLSIKILNVLLAKI